MTRVKKDKVVAFRYTMRNSRMEILEDTMNGLPTVYLHGSSDIEALLQGQLEGLERGDRKKIYLLEGSGLISANFTFDIIIDDVRDASEEELMLGYPLQVNVQKCEADCSCYEAETESL